MRLWRRFSTRTVATLVFAPIFKFFYDFAHHIVCLLQVVNMDVVIVPANKFFEFFYLLRQRVLFAKEYLKYLVQSRGFPWIVVSGYEFLTNNFRDRYIDAILNIR